MNSTGTAALATAIGCTLLLVIRGRFGTHNALDLTPRNLYVDDLDPQGRQSLSVVALPR